MTISTQELVKQVAGLDEEEDISQVVAAIKIARNRINAIKRLGFRKGQRVEFDSRRGVLVRGKITKINQKTILVEEPTGVSWRVSPSLLRGEEYK